MHHEQVLRKHEDESTGGALTIEPFNQTLCKHGLKLNRARTTTLQINVGLRCNQVCRHCHLSAGPGRKENMDQKTIDEVV